MFDGAFTAAGSLIGGELDRQSAKRQSSREWRRQKEFAKNQLQWRVQDAKNAGIHPLAAIGAQTTGYTPQAIYDPGYSEQFAKMGQAVGRAVQNKLDPYEKKLRELELQHKEAVVQGQQIQNNVTLKQLQPHTSLKPSGLDNPPYNWRHFEDIDPNFKVGTGYQNGIKPMFAAWVKPNGAVAVTYSENVAESLESDWLGNITEALKRVYGALGFAGDNLFRKHDPQLLEDLYSIRPRSPYKGYEFRYNPNTMDWWLQRIEHGSRIIFKPEEGLKYVK